MSIIVAIELSIVDIILSEQRKEQKIERKNIHA